MSILKVRNVSYLTILIILLFLFITKTSFAEEETIFIDTSAGKRSALIFTPSNFSHDNKLFPAIIAFHGGGGNSEGFKNQTNFNFYAEKEGFIVVYPQGIGAMSLQPKNGSWNAGNCCGPALKKNVDDIGFTKAIINLLINKHKANPQKIYATGFSNGSKFSYRLACELSDKIAAIAAVSSVPAKLNCHPQRAIPIFHIHGKLDPCAKFEGGKSGGCFGKFMQSMFLPFPEETFSDESVFDYLSFWQERNSCERKWKQKFKHDQVSCLEAECPEKSAITLCTIADGGHEWPGGSEPVKACLKKPSGIVCKKWKSIVGKLSKELNASEEIIKFFKKFSL